MADNTLSFDARIALAAGPTIEAIFDWSFAAGPILALFGPSGAGKTTILRALAGLETPSDGRISFGGERWLGPGVRLTPQQRRVGLLFQDYALFPHLTVRANVGYQAGSAARVNELLERFEIAHLAGKHPQAISGGERQRVALARTLAPEPRLLLLDEPLSALDAPTRERLRGDLRRRLLAARTPTIVVTHDRLEAQLLGDGLAVMIDGRLRQIGPIEEVFSRPADAEVAHVVGVETLAPAVVENVEAGLATLRLGSQRLLAPALEQVQAGQEGFAAIRGEDVALALQTPGAGSIRNRLEARIVELAPEGPLVRVRLDAGFALTALITRPAAEDLALEPGRAVWAAVKATAIHFVPHATTPRGDEVVR